MSSEIEQFLRRLAEGRLQIDDDDEEEIIDAELIEEDAPPAPQGGDASATSVFADSSGLPETVDHVEDLAENRFQHDFGHQLGQFANSKEEPVTSDPNRAPWAADLARMLRSPRSLRTAILLSEVIARPEHRWRMGESLDEV